MGRRLARRGVTVLRWWNPKYLPLILASIGFNFFIGRALHRRSARAKALLAFGVAANLVLLGVFKYADFAVRNAADLTGLPLALPHIVLPLGISFFTFTQMHQNASKRTGTNLPGCLQFPAAAPTCLARLPPAETRTEVA
jgi:D-alanyl-lipoteichoic acid acyltransferase DltB (MBOAT superfamily)